MPVAQGGDLALLIRKLARVLLHLLLLAAHAVQARDVLPDALLVALHRGKLRLDTVDFSVGIGDAPLAFDDIGQLFARGIAQIFVLHVSDKYIRSQIRDGKRGFVNALFSDRKFFGSPGRELHFETIRRGGFFERLPFEKRVAGARRMLDDQRFVFLIDVTDGVGFGLDCRGAGGQDATLDRKSVV